MPEAKLAKEAEYAIQRFQWLQTMIAGILPWLGNRWSILNTLNKNQKMLFIYWL